MNSKSSNWPETLQREVSWLQRSKWIEVTNCDHLWENPAKVIFFRCQCLCVLLIYIMCRIFCAKDITVFITFWNVGLGTWKKVIFIYFWSLNFKGLLNIFLHFGMEKMYQRGNFFYFSTFSQNFAWQLWPGFLNFGVLNIRCPPGRGAR
jgi:hypothetical protein